MSPQCVKGAEDRRYIRGKTLGFSRMAISNCLVEAITVEMKPVRRTIFWWFFFKRILKGTGPRLRIRSTSSTSRPTQFVSRTIDPDNLSALFPVSVFPEDQVDVSFFMCSTC